MRVYGEDDMKDILRNREEKLKNIRQKMFSLYNELSDTDALVRSVAVKTAGLSGMPTGKNTHQDTGDVLLRYQGQLQERNTEIRQIMWSLAEEEESICRVWNCFYALRDPYYAILNALYVENQVYQSVKEDFGCSHKTFEKKRKEGIDLLIQFYESRRTAGELICQAEKTRKPKARPQTNAYHQMSLQELLDEETKDREREGKRV